MAKEKLPVPTHPGYTGALARFQGMVKTKKVVTVPHLKQDVDQAVWIKILDPIRKAAPMKVRAGAKETKESKAEKMKEPPFLANVESLDPERLGTFTYIFNAVVKDNIEDLYPDDGYVGKQFLILKGPKRPGKDYNQFHIEEVEPA